MWWTWIPRQPNIEAGENHQSPFQHVHNILTTIGTRTFEWRMRKEREKKERKREREERERERERE